MSDNDMILSLKGDTFCALKEDFDSILARTVGNMEMKGAEDATITMKLGISLEKTSVSGPGGVQNITKPSFKHDISSVMQVKDKKSGALTGDYILVWDEVEGKFVMRRIDNGQMNIFDTQGYGAEAHVVDAEYDEVPGLPPASPSMLSDGSQDAESGDDEDEGYDTDESDDTEPEPAEELQDAPVDPYDPETPFGWMYQFVGKEMKVTEAMGNYSIRTADNKVVLTSSCDPRSPFYCSAEKLKAHAGHKLICFGTPEDADVFGTISIWCQDCGEEIYELGRPGDEEEYGYDGPEDDEPEDEE